MRKNCSNYPFEFVTDAFAEDNAVLRDVLRTVTGAERPRVFIVADMNVVQHTAGLGTKIGRYLQAQGVELAGSPVVVTCGEFAKDDGFASVGRIFAAALAAKVGRNDVMLAIGGGTLLDLAGYAAAQVRGGLRLVRMPTTPLAMIDSAHAETAVLNVQGVKDALKVAIAPAAVVIDFQFAANVLDGVWRGGYAAALRVAYGSDSALVKRVVKLASQYRARDWDAMVALVRDCSEVRRKKGDSGFGLWSALRLESMSGFKLPHGYAIGLGMLIDSQYAVLKGRFSQTDRDVLVQALTESGVMEGAMHSRSCLGDVDGVLLGFNAWSLATGEESVPELVAPGKVALGEKTDRNTMKEAINLVK